jgi:hypothetical protein
MSLLSDRVMGAFMELPEDLKAYRPVAFFDMDENETATAAVVVIVLIAFANWQGWL